MNECNFDTGKRCAILNVPYCPKSCKFRKTEVEFWTAQKVAAEILEKKGLRPVIKKSGNSCIMSVERDK